MKNKILSVLITSIFILSAIPQSTYAIDKTQLHDPGVTPDSPLYVFDTLFDQIGLALVFGKDKAVKAASVARERLSEAQKMSVAGNLNAVQAAQKEYQNSLDIIKDTATSIYKKSPFEEAEDVIEIEKEIEKIERLADEVNSEIAVRIFIAGEFTEEQKARLNEIFQQLASVTGDVKVSISTKKEQIKERIQEQTGRTEQEVENELFIIEDRYGLIGIKKDKAFEAIRLAQEEISEAISKFKKVFGFPYDTPIDIIVQKADEVPAVETGGQSPEIQPEAKSPPSQSQAGGSAPAVQRVVAAVEQAIQSAPEIVKQRAGKSFEEPVLVGKYGIKQISRDFERTETSVSTGAVAGNVEETMFIPIAAASPAEQIDENDIENILVKKPRAHAITRLIKEALGHYAKAKSAFADEKYGEAYGQATAAFKLARNANKLMDDILDETDDEKPVSSIKFETIIQGANSNVVERKNVVINTQEEFDRLIDKMGVLTFAPIEIDFEKSSVVAVFMGEQTTGGFGIEVEKIVKSSYVSSTPGSSGGGGYGSPANTGTTNIAQNCDDCDSFEFELNEGEIANFVFGDEGHTLTLLVVSDADTAGITVDTSTKSIDVGRTVTISGVDVYLKNVKYTSKTGTVSSAIIIVHKNCRQECIDIVPAPVPEPSTPEQESQYIVHVKETLPAPGNPVIMVLTQPYHIVKTFEKLDGSVEFVHSTVSHDQPPSQNKFLIMHRTVKNCNDDSTVIINGVSEQIIPVGKGTSYWNFRCENRYQEQCIDDGTFDTYYDEWCEERVSDFVIEVAVYNEGSTVKITKAGKESVRFVLETQDLEVIIREIHARTGLDAEQIKNNLVLKVNDYSVAKPEPQNKTEKRVCCQKYGFGAYMEKVSIEYEWKDADECKTPQDFVGGGREIVSDLYCTVD